MRTPDCNRLSVSRSDMERRKGRGTGRVPFHQPTWDREISIEEREGYAQAGRISFSGSLNVSIGTSVIPLAPLMRSTVPSSLKL